ncbi:Uncharacterised protein [Klebsiella michiganensis]|uniref:Uncharacterized protein n=1 Tax=Klebsiella michiganensis TaxID=1134687 RepID=A0A7H4N5U9_9ENTR|nr:Uncharacterised protein [Klebsiella michiganensis]
MLARGGAGAQGDSTCATEEAFCNVTKITKKFDVLFFVISVMAF